MMPPELVLRRLLAGLAAGAALGLCHGLLTPLRSRRPWLADGVFSLALGWAWLWLGFGIWQGDLRVGYFVPLFVGCVLWEMTLGPVLSPVFCLFWKILGRIWTVFVWPVKKFCILQKFCLHLGKNGLQ